MEVVIIKKNRKQLSAPICICWAEAIYILESNLVKSFTTFDDTRRVADSDINEDSFISRSEDVNSTLENSEECRWYQVNWKVIFIPGVIDMSGSSSGSDTKRVA